MPWSPLIQPPELEAFFIVACRQAPDVLDATEACFYPQRSTIAPFIVAEGTFA
jgi:hypothetical protein